MDDRAAIVFPEPLETRRLALRALTPDSMDAWILGDAERLQSTIGAHFEGAPAAPPLDLDDLVHVRERLGERSGDPAWWAWMVVLRSSERPIGLVTLAGSAGDDGGVAFGYAVYPDQHGNDYEREAIEGLLAWTLAQPGVRVVRAAIPAWNDESIRVAERVGMHAAGTTRDPDLGELVVFERSTRRRPAVRGRA